MANWNDDVITGDCFNADAWMAMRDCIKRKEADFIIYQEGGIVYALNGNTGNIDFSDADAATVIQFAIDARTYVQRSLIFIKSGLYIITKKINLKGNLEFRGAGMGCTKLSANDQGQDYDILSWTPTTNEYFLVIRDMTIEGDGVSGTSGHCIYFDDEDGGDTNDCQIDHVMTIYAVDTGIYAKTNWGFRLTNSISEYSGAENLKVGTTPQVYVSNCYFAYAKGDFGVRIDSSKCIFIGNTVYANEKYGILLSGGRECQQIVNNNISGNGTVAVRDGIWIDCSNHKAIITGNQIFDNSRYGINVDSDDCVIDENRMSGNTTADISDSGDRNIINGLSNNAGVPGVAGVWAVATKWGVMVRDTINNKTYIYADGGWREISAF